MIDQHLYTSVVCEVGNDIYIVDTWGEKPCIFRINPEERSSELLVRIERADSKAPKMVFVGATYFEGLIFFVPRFIHGINYIVIFEIETCKVRYKEIIDPNFVPYCGYESLNRIGDELWLFPQDVQNDVAVFSLRTEELYIMREWGRVVRQLQDRLGCILKSGDAILVDNRIYIPLANTQYIASFDIENSDTQIYSLGNNIRLTFPIVYTGKDFWLSKRKNEGLVCWNPEKGVLSEIAMGRYENSRLDNYQGWYQKMVYSNQCLWILPKNDNVLLRIATESSEMQILKISESEKKEDLDDRQYWTIEREGILRIYPRNCSWSVDVNIIGDEKISTRNEMYQPKEWSQQARGLLYSGTWKYGEILQEDLLQDLIKYLKFTNN